MHIHTQLNLWVDALAVTKSKQIYKRTLHCQSTTKAKKKKGLFPVSRPTLFFGADPELFFNFQKKIQSARRKMTKKSSKSVERFKSYKQLQK